MGTDECQGMVPHPGAAAIKLLSVSTMATEKFRPGHFDSGCFTASYPELNIIPTGHNNHKDNYCITICYSWCDHCHHLGLERFLKLYFIIVIVLSVNGPLDSN